MKKFCCILILTLLLSLGVCARADGSVEVIVMDGVPVVMEYFAPQGDEFAEVHSKGINLDAGAGFTFPAALAAIEESAFEGVSAERVEITENVISIGARAFANCPNLRALVIPATVQYIDDTALEGSDGVTVYGEKGSEAWRFAEANGIPFVDTKTESETYEKPKPPAVLPYMAF